MSQAPRTLQALRAADVMTRHPVTMDITGTVQDAVDLMCAADVRHIPVVEHGTLVGMISDRDVWNRCGSSGHPMHMQQVGTEERAHGLGHRKIHTMPRSVRVSSPVVLG